MQQQQESRKHDCGLEAARMQVKSALGGPKGTRRATVRAQSQEHTVIAPYWADSGTVPTFRNTRQGYTMKFLSFPPLRST